MFTIDKYYFELRKLGLKVKPERYQRFRAAPSWEVAEANSQGYGRRSELEHNRPAEQSQVSLTEEVGLRALITAIDMLQVDQLISVLDFGGFDGRYATLVRDAFPDREISWTVVETPQVVDFFSTRSTDVTYTSNLSDGLRERPAIVFASGSLHYVPNPNLILSEIAENTDLVVLHRLPLWPIPNHEAAVQTVTRSPDLISYPTWFFSANAFREHASESFETILRFESPEDRAYFAGHYCTYSGLVLKGLSKAHEAQT